MPDTDNLAAAITELTEATRALKDADTEAAEARHRRDAALVATAALKRKQAADITGLTVTRVQQIIDAAKTS